MVGFVLVALVWSGLVWFGFANHSKPFGVVCTLIDNHTRFHSGLTGRSAKPRSICFLPLYQRESKCFLLKKALRDTSTRASLPKFIQTDNASSSVKTANVTQLYGNSISFPKKKKKHNKTANRRDSQHPIWRRTPREVIKRKRK